MTDKDRERERDHERGVLSDTGRRYHRHQRDKHETNGGGGYTPSLSRIKSSSTRLATSSPSPASGAWFLPSSSSSSLWSRSHSSSSVSCGDTLAGRALFALLVFLCGVFIVYLAVIFISFTPIFSTGDSSDVSASASSPNATVSPSVRWHHSRLSHDLQPIGIDLHQPISTSISLSSSLPVSVVRDPSHIVASDGVTYKLSDYKDGFVWPDKVRDHNTPVESAMYWADASKVIPSSPWRPLPPHLTPSKPRVDFILRTFAGYSSLTSYMLRSLEVFVPVHSLGEVIVVLDDNPADHHYANTLPDYVKIYYETPPAYFSEWRNEAQSQGLGIERPNKGYNLGVYSSWLADRYSDADYICVLDPDMMFITRASLPLMFDWDEQQHLYKPVWICRDYPENFFIGTSYARFNLTGETAPGCMFQLPVCIHRSTLKTVRAFMNDMYYHKNPNDFVPLGFDYTIDRDSDFPAYKKYYDTLLATPSVAIKPPAYMGAIPPSAFDRTYLRMVNEDTSSAVCQFCVWGSYIMLHPEEKRKYSFHIQGGKFPRSECSQLRVGTHTGYLVPAPKISAAYYTLGDTLLAIGICKASLPTDCNRLFCDAAGFSYYTSLKKNSASLTADVLQQELLLKWEYQPMWATPQHEHRCRAWSMQQIHQLYTWIQNYDLMPSNRRGKMCSNHALKCKDIP